MTDHLSSAPLHRSDLSQTTIFEILGGDHDKRARLCDESGYTIDAILAASAEFRRTVGGAPFRWMTRGEALHIARVLAACGADHE